MCTSCGPGAGRPISIGSRGPPALVTAKALMPLPFGRVAMVDLYNI